MPTSKVPDSERRRCAKACRTCKRRKERCDGLQPCRRCDSRGDGAGCDYARAPAPRRAGRRPSEDPVSAARLPSGASYGSWPRPARVRRAPVAALEGGTVQIQSPEGSSPDHPLSWPSPDTGCALTSCRDTASLTYLQSVRRLVDESLGSRPLTDASRKPEVAAGSSPWPDGGHGPPPKPTAAEARVLVDWCMRQTSHMLGSIVDASSVERDVLRWLTERSEGTDFTDATHYLILAIGAQSCPSAEDELAETYFRFGRHHAASRYLDGHTISSMQCHIWIAFYLINACRTEAAADAIAMAVRAAYTLGIHQPDLLRALPEDECAARERLWKTLRKLDLFISLTDGRPTASYETRDIHASCTYSPGIDICAIAERMVLDLYLRRKSHDTSLVRDLAERHRLWAVRLTHGLAADGITYTERIEGIDSLPLYFVKGGYYWSIMLLTRPFLLEHVSAYVAQRRTSPPPHQKERLALDDSDASTVHVQACLDSAVHAIDLTKATLSRGEIPKRIPFLVNLVFTAALTLSVAIFADLDSTFPLGKGLSVCQHLLGYFRDHDALARFYGAAIRDLQQAHDEYLERRSRHMMELRQDVLGRVFGRIPPQERDDDTAAIATADAPWYLRPLGDDLTMEDHTAAYRQPTTTSSESPADDAFFRYTSPVTFGHIPNDTVSLNELGAQQQSTLDDFTLSFPGFAGV